MKEEIEEFLAHHGVKGMHWGVRKDYVSDAARSGLTTREAKKDLKWAKKASSQKTYFQIYNSMADRLNREMEDFNNQPKYRDKDLTTNKSLAKQYYNDYSKRATTYLNDAAKKYGVSPSGNLRLEYAYDVSSDQLPRWKIVDDTVKHFGFGDGVNIVTKYDDQGKITHISFVATDEMEHDGLSHYGNKSMRLGAPNRIGLPNSEENYMTDVEDFLAHHGVKGMHWGIRRDPQSGIRPIAKALSNSKFGKLSKKNVENHHKRQSRKETILTSLDLPGHRRIVTPEQKNKDRKIILGAMGATAVIAGAAWLANRRWQAGADARKFKKYAPILRARVSGISEFSTTTGRGQAFLNGILGS